MEIPVSFVNAVAGTGRHVSAAPEPSEASSAKPEPAEPVSQEASSAEAVPERIEASSPDAGPAPAETVPAQPSSGGRRKALKAVLIALGTCVAVAGLLLAVFLILADVAPDFIDSILYTPEELRIINY